VNRRENKDRKELGQSIQIFVFLILVFGITLLGLFVPVKAFSENENRYLATKPQFNWKSLISGKYTTQYEDYITDQFIYRDKWISLKTLSERALLKQDINSVYFGKDGYLVEKHPMKKVEPEVEDRNYQRLIEFVKQYKGVLGEDNVKVMLVPTASSILKDKLPKFATGYSQDAFIDKVKGELTKENVIDVRELLLSHNKEYIYYKTDHHWTSLGAYYAYTQWAKETGEEYIPMEEFNQVLASDKFYGTLHSKVNVDMEADSIYLYEIMKDMDYSVRYDGEKESNTLYELSYLDTKDKYSVFLSGNHGLVEINTNNKNGKKLLVIKDSFAHSFVPFAVNHYESTHMIDLRYFNMGIKDYIEQNEITDVLVLYNVMNYVTDKNTSKLLK
jgi:hypothetical protein